MENSNIKKRGLNRSGFMTGFWPVIILTIAMIALALIIKYLMNR